MRPFLGSKKLKYSSSGVNVYFNGNSIVYGSYLPSQTYAPPEVMSTLAPLASAGLSVANLGHSGYRWEDLTPMTDADAAFVPGKTNVLLAMENANSLGSGDTAAQCIAAARAYVAARLAAHPSVRLVIVTSIPYRADPTLNATMLTVNAAFLANYRAWGCAACVDLRAPGSPFNNFSTYSAAEYAATGIYTSDSMHPNTAGAAIIAQMCANTLYRLAA